MHGLAAALPHRLERDERARRGQPGFLAELPQRSREQIVRPHQALGNGPGAVVLARPERAARMRQQDFDLPAPAVGEEPRADFVLACHRAQYSRRAADRAALRIVAVVSAAALSSTGLSLADLAAGAALSSAADLAAGAAFGSEAWPVVEAFGLVSALALPSAPCFMAGSLWTAPPAFASDCSLALSADTNPGPANNATAATVAISDFFIQTSPLVSPRGRMFGQAGNVERHNSVPAFSNFHVCSLLKGRSH